MGSSAPVVLRYLSVMKHVCARQKFLLPPVVLVPKLFHLRWLFRKEEEEEVGVEGSREPVERASPYPRKRVSAHTSF